MSEHPPASPPERRPTETEAVLADFRKSCALDEGHVYNAEERDAITHTLHDKLEQLNAAEMLHMYEAGTAPTLDSMNRAAEVAIDALREDPEDVEAVTHAKLIQGQAAQMHRWSRRYVETVVKFHTSRTAYARANDAELRDMLVRADTERRRVHEALMASLTTFNNFLLKAQDLVTFPAPIAWKPGMSLAPGTSQEQAVVFSTDVIRDRQLMRDWAIVADAVEQLRIVVRKMEETEKNKTAAP